jgi:hypothetical protein
VLRRLVRHRPPEAAEARTSSPEVVEQPDGRTAQAPATAIDAKPAVAATTRPESPPAAPFASSPDRTAAAHPADAEPMLDPHVSEAAAEHAGAPAPAPAAAPALEGAPHAVVRTLRRLARRAPSPRSSAAPPPAAPPRPAPHIEPARAVYRDSSPAPAVRPVPRELRSQREAAEAGEPARGDGIEVAGGDELQADAEPGAPSTRFALPLGEIGADVAAEPGEPGADLRLPAGDVAAAPAELVLRERARRAPAADVESPTPQAARIPRVYRRAATATAPSAAPAVPAPAAAGQAIARAEGRTASAAATAAAPYVPASFESSSDGPHLDRVDAGAPASPAAAPAEAGAGSPPPESEPIEEPGSDEPDPQQLERLAQQVYDRLRRRFVTERERAGRGARWR